jgi:hypothetical protein
MQGTAQFRHQITDPLLPPASPVLHDAAALDTAVAMLDPQPLLVERLVGPLLRPRALLPQIEINSIDDSWMKRALLLVEQE